MTEVLVENIEPGEGKVVAEFTAILGGVTIHGCRLVDGSRGRFVAMPSKRRRNTEPAEWLPVVELTDALRSRVHHAIEDALAQPARRADADIAVPL
jgi:DNA-binding cell septation regulator SpoVG